MPVISRRPAGPDIETENALYGPSLELPVSRGWPALFKPVRDSDLVKVNDCKDDIDTLLVFAGLYSAVLTAFIIESYQSLQQDKQDVMIDLMQRQLMKDYAISAGFLNSTILMPPPLPPFEPPLWAIRVNVLWFSSLILSLGAASFGMLVKQWLREYLALDYLSARERLCAREYRNPSLATWGVFEIAATLPLVLQLSLCLFFVGLCFFTSAVHSSIGYTTIPVVAAWAFLFLITTVAPLFSPRCPYKTTFLKATIKSGRHFVAPFVRPLAHACIQRGSSVVRAILRAVARRDLDASYTKHDVEAVDWDQLLLEEEAIVRSNRADVDILLSVDANRADDALVPNMLMALDQPKDALNLTEFVIRIINDRHELSLPVRSLTSIPDLRGLSKHLWLCLTDALAHALGTLMHDESFPIDPPSWTIDAVILLLSQSDFELPSEGVRMLQIFFGKEEGHSPLAGILGERLCQAESPLRLPLVPQLLRNLKSGGRFPCHNCLSDLYTARLHQKPEHDTSSLRSFLRARSADPPFWSSKDNVHVLEDLLKLSSDFLAWAIPIPTSPRCGHLIELTIDLCHALEQHDTLVAVCKLGLQYTYESPTFMSAFGALHPSRRVLAFKADDEISAGILTKVFQTSSSQSCETMIANLCLWHERYTAGNYDDTAVYVSIDIVRICCVLLRVQQHLRTSTSGDEVTGLDDSAHAADRADWPNLWKALTEALRKYYNKQGWTSHTQWDAPRTPSEEALQHDRLMAAECLGLIHGHLGQLPCGTPQDSVNPETPSAQELSDVLRLFIDNEAAQSDSAAIPPSSHSIPDDPTPEEGSAISGPDSTPLPPPRHPIPSDTGSDVGGVAPGPDPTVASSSLTPITAASSPRYSANNSSGTNSGPGPDPEA